MKEAHSITTQVERRVRTRFTNRFKCLLCYLICFSIPLLWQAAGLFFVYPYRLAGTAPSVAANVAHAVPALASALESYAQAADLSRAAGNPNALAAAIAARDAQWRAAVGGWFALAWLMTLLIQLLWRATHAKATLASRATSRAVRAYRLSFFAILLINALFAAALWLVGARFIAGRTAWDYLAYFAAYILNLIAALCCFRLAAPPVLSGKHAFFKRL